MGHAGTKPEFNLNRVEQPVRSHGAQTGRTLPPPPPLAATQYRSARVPKAPPPALPIVPQWVPEASVTPLSHTGSTRGTNFWGRVVGTGVAAGLLIAAGYLGAMAQLERHQPRLIEVHHVRPAPLPLAASTAHENVKVAETLQPSAAPASALSATPVRPTPPTVLTSTVAVPAAQLFAPTRTLTSSAAAPVAHKSLKHAGAKPAAVAGEESDDGEADDSESEDAVVTPKTTAKENLPEQPSRTDVQRGLEQIRPQLAGCTAGAHGTTYANVTVVGAGRVSYSFVEGAFSGTPAGSCMARVMRAASFPRFSGDALKVRYPFVF